MSHLFQKSRGAADQGLQALQSLQAPGHQEVGTQDRLSMLITILVHTDMVLGTVTGLDTATVDKQLNLAGSALEYVPVFVCYVVFASLYAWLSVRRYEGRKPVILEEITITMKR